MAVPVSYNPYQYPRSRLGNRHIQKADLLRDLESTLDLLERQVDPLSSPATLSFLDDTDLPDKTFKYAHPNIYYLDRSSTAPADGINVILPGTGLGRWIITSFGGLTPTQHEYLDTLTHEVVENSFVDLTRVAGQVTQVTVWTSPAKLLKIRDTVITRTAGQVSQVVERQYDGSGALLYTLTHSITRSSGTVTSVTTTRT